MTYKILQIMLQIFRSHGDIRSKIPHGGIAEICKVSGVSRYTIKRVLDGKSNNKKALAAIAQYIDELASVKKSIESNLIHI